VQRSQTGQNFLMIQASRSHSDTSHSVGHLWTSEQPDAETCTSQHSQEIDIYAPGGIRTRNPNKQAASDQRYGQWVRPFVFTSFSKLMSASTKRCLERPSCLAHCPLPPRHQQIQLPNFILCQATSTISHNLNTSPSSDDDVLLKGFLQT
jgi:hypothetical protein